MAANPADYTVPAVWMTAVNTDTGKRRAVAALLHPGNTTGTLRAYLPDFNRFVTNLTDSDVRVGTQEYRDHATNTARAETDHYEHHADHPEFINEHGGHAGVEREYTRRCHAFITLNTTTSTPAQVAFALAVVANIEAGN